MYVEYLQNVTNYAKENIIGVKLAIISNGLTCGRIFQCSSLFLRIHSFYKYLIDIVFAEVVTGGLHKKF